MRDQDGLRTALENLAAAVAIYREARPPADADSCAEPPLHWLHPFVNGNDDVFVFERAS